MRMIAGLLTLACLSSPVAADDGHKHGAPAGGVQTLTGEVLDMACYMAHDGRGKKHKKCAEMCVLGGTPMGLAAKDGSVYLLLEDHAKKEPYAGLKKLVAEQAKVTGKVVNKGGVQALLVEKVEKAK